MEELKVGDEVTIAGCLVLVRNPDRRWWQFWKPRMIMSGELQRFRVTGKA
jgi:hypothetical protein